MNLIKAFTEYLAPVLDGALPWLGTWEDVNENNKRAEYLSINLQPAARPGVISQTRMIELWFVSQANVNDIDGAKMAAYEKAEAICQYMIENPGSSCFANVIPIAGIIGPKDTTDMRQVYLIPIEVTY